jgi:hypothetical protein
MPDFTELWIAYEWNRRDAARTIELSGGIDAIKRIIDDAGFRPQNIHSIDIDLQRISATTETCANAQIQSLNGVSPTTVAFCDLPDL